MKIRVEMNGQDVTGACRLQDTRIQYDSTRRIANAHISIMGQALIYSSRYDSAHYDEDRYGVDLRELYEVVIYDDSDSSRMFAGQVFAIEMEQSDATDFQIFYKCELADYASWLDRSVAWGGADIPMPTSDKILIETVIGLFCPRIQAADVAEIIPTIQEFDWKGKTCRQILDDVAALAMAEWFVDFDSVLHYRLASEAPPAPFKLSTSPDFVTSFPVRVSGYKHDFTNPVNRAYVRGAMLAEGVPVEASYSDPISVGLYGELAQSVVDEQITTAWDASLRAKSIVLRFAYPAESGNFTIWRDGLKVGQQVEIEEEILSINGPYIIRSLSLQWEDPELVRYEAQFGASQPNLETLLRLMDQRARWKTSQPVKGATPGPGSITDEHIAVPPGLSAGSIGSINANTIIGTIEAGQIGSVNAGVIVGAIQAEQIDSVNATTIQGAIVADQIGSVNAVTIQGVIVSSQLADRIIDSLAKYADVLRPIQIVRSGDPWPPAMPNPNFPPNSFFYFEADGNFYQVTPDGLTWIINNSPQNVQMEFFNIGAMRANSIIGLIIAAQIQSITAGQITGMIQAGQIESINASSISGQIVASQIASVNASVIQGTISGTQIDTIAAEKITGSIVSTQIGSINAATITIGLIVDGQIGNVSGAKLTVGTVNSDKLNTTELAVGGGGNKPGVINVYNGSLGVVAKIGTLGGSDFGGWFKQFGAGGTQYADAKVRTDISGNLFIRDSDLLIINSTTATQIRTGPTTFGSDGGYSSIMLIAEQTSGSGDKAGLVSRGMVIYSGSTKVAALVRSPSGAYGELEFPTGIYISISSVTGRVRADGGFQVAGTLAIDSARNFSGAQLNLTGDVVAGGKVRFSGTQASTGVGSAVINGKFPVYDYAGNFLGWAYTFNG